MHRKWQPQRYFRRSERKESDCFGIWDGRGRCVGRSRDLSTGGVFLETSVRPPLGSVVDISVITEDDGRLECRALVVRHTGNGIGLLFGRSTPDFRHAIERMLRPSS